MTNSLPNYQRPTENANNRARATRYVSSADTNIAARDRLATPSSASISLADAETPNHGAPSPRAFATNGLQAPSTAQRLPNQEATKTGHPLLALGAIGASMALFSYNPQLAIQLALTGFGLGCLLQPAEATQAGGERDHAATNQENHNQQADEADDLIGIEPLAAQPSANHWI